MALKLVTRTSPDFARLDQDARFLSIRYVRFVQNVRKGLSLRRVAGRERFVSTQRLALSVDPLTV